MLVLIKGVQAFDEIFALTLGVFFMFDPVLWLTLSSFKTKTQLLEFPPAFLPYGAVSINDRTPVREMNFA